MLGAERFEASYSPWRLLLLSLLSGGWVFVGLWMIGAFGDAPEGPRLGPDPIYPLGWFLIIVCSAGAVLIIRKTFSGGIAITIDNYGIHDRRLSSKPIQWDNIEQIGSYTMRGGIKFVGIAVRDPEQAGITQFARYAAGMNSSITPFPYAIGTVGTDKSHAQILAAIDHFSP